MKQNLFRKKTMNRVASPEQLDDYIHVSSPAAWVVLAAFAVLLVGACIWGVFGRLDTTVSVVAIKEAGSAVCYVKESDRAEVAVGMPVSINGEEYTVIAAQTDPIRVDADFPEYAKHVGGLDDGEWVYRVYTDCSAGVEGEVFSADIVVERVKPIYFVTN